MRVTIHAAKTTLSKLIERALRALLCPEADERCGEETDGWTAAAARAFEEQEQPWPDDWVGECAREARTGRRATRYQRWRECIASRAGGGPAWPLGRFRAPKDGWLAIWASDRLDVYDLTTGAAYFGRKWEPCRGCCAANPVTPPPPEAKAGRVPAHPLRQATLAILLAPYADEDVQVKAKRVRLPPGLIPQWVPAETRIGSLSGRGCFSFHNYTPRWLWIRQGAVAARGTLASRCGSGAPAYAKLLLRRVEESFVPGCPPAIPPWPLPERTGYRASLDEIVDAAVQNPTCLRPAAR